MGQRREPRWDSDAMKQIQNSVTRFSPFCIVLYFPVSGV